MASIFISYAREDRGHAHAVANFLDAHGHNCWWDFELVGGQDYRREIDKRLTASDVVIVLWSKNSVLSTWVLEEAEEGAARNALVPVLIDDIKVPMGFRGIQAIDLRLWDGETDFPALDDLLAALGQDAAKDRKHHAAIKQTPLRRAAARNTILIMMAGVWNVINGMLDPLVQTGIDPTLRNFVTILFFLMALGAWFAKTKVVASISLMLATSLGITIALRLLMLTEDTGFGIMSNFSVLLISGTLVWAIILGAIRLTESSILIAYTITAFSYFSIMSGYEPYPDIISSVVGIAVVGVGALFIRIKYIQKFFV